MGIFAEFCGWSGAVLVLVGYYLVSGRKVSGDSLLFQGMNIGGACLLIIYTYNRGAYANTAVNSMWVIIGCSSLYRFRKNKNPLANSEKTIKTT